MNKQLPYVLCVDDDQLNLDLLSALLEGKYEINCLTDGQQCLDAVNKRMPDMILLDIMMPVLDGKAVCKQLKGSAETASIPILVLSGRSFQDDIEALYDLGADSYLVKPFSAENLFNEMNKFLSS